MRGTGVGGGSDNWLRWRARIVHHFVRGQPAQSQYVSGKPMSRCDFVLLPWQYVANLWHGGEEKGGLGASDVTSAFGPPLPWLKIDDVQLGKGGWRVRAQRYFI